MLNCIHHISLFLFLLFLAHVYVPGALLPHMDQWINGKYFPVHVQNVAVNLI